jgi:hypothetical protein
MGLKQQAVDRLTQPGIAVDFPDHVLYVLLKQAPPGDLSLAMAYYHTVSPIISSPKYLEPLFNAICSLGVSEAFYFARTQVSQGHRHLFEQLIAFVLRLHQGAARAQQSVELINQPFTAEEEEWFEYYLAHGRARSLPGAADTLNMRRIATARYNAAVGDGNGASGRVVDGVSWGVLREGLKNGMGPRLTLGSSNHVGG